MDNISCHNCIYASTDEAIESSHSKKFFGLILSGKSCVGDISVKESGKLKCFCSICGQKPNELSLSHDDDDAFSVPAVTLENVTQQLLKLVLNQKVKVTFIQKVLKSHYKYWFSGNTGRTSRSACSLSSSFESAIQPFQPWLQNSCAITVLPKLPGKNWMG